MPFTVPTQPLSPMARRPKMRPTSPDDDDVISSSDELADEQYATQATQIVDRPTLASSPARLSSTVEVPASSPYQQPGKPVIRLASAMAPRGTAFKPPAIRQPFRPNQILGKRPSPTVDLTTDSDPEPVVVIDSSEDENTRPRGDIRPTDFHRRSAVTPVSSTASSVDPPSPVGDVALPPKGSQQEKRLTRLAFVGPQCLSKLVPGRSDPDYLRALVICNGNKDDAADHLRRATKKARPNGNKPSGTKTTARNASDIRSFIRSFGHKPSGVVPSPPTTLKDETEDETKEETDEETGEVIVATPSPKKTLGRLRRGLKPRSSPSPVKPVLQSAEPIPISDSDDDEAFSRSASPDLADDAKQDKATRILKYLNECALEGLLALKIKKNLASVVIENRPFRSLRAVEKLKLSNVARRGRAPKNSSSKDSQVGDQILEAVTSYISALDAIGDIVSTCAAENDRIKAITSGWSMDSKGVTPDGKTVGLPIAREPKFLRGNCQMKPYQLYGLNWLHTLYQLDYGAILADDMGLGKTCQVIATLSHIVESYDETSSQVRPWPNLVIVPPSTFSNWQAELERFAPSLNVTMFHGKPSDRDDIGEDIRDDPEQHHVVLTTYTQITRDEDVAALARIRPNAFICDEGQQLKNSATKLYRSLSRVTARWRLLLTGTPIQNNYMELISLLSFIQPKVFERKTESLKEFFTTKASLEEVGAGALLFSDRIRRAKTFLEPFVLQRLKSQVLSSLPPKTSRVQYCDMAKSQREIYDDYRSQFRKGQNSGTVAPKAAPKDDTNDKNNIWIQLRKAAIHEQLFRRFYSDAKVDEMAGIMMRKIPQSRLCQPQLRHLVAELKNSSDFQLHLWCRDEKCIASYDVAPDSWMQSGKVQALLELLREYRRNGDRALVFTRFATVVEILSECLASADIPHLSLQGSTAVAERQGLIDEFNSNDDLTAFLLTTGAGGTGINLASANRVVFFDLSDNPQDDQQAESRAHRLGQTRPVEVVRLISKDSVEEMIYKAGQKKMEMAQQVTGMSPEQISREVEEEVRQQLMAES